MPSSYPLTCVGMPTEVPDPSLGCTVLPIPTPSNETIYCCPCANEPADSGVKLPACTWPSSLDGDASSRTACHAARALVSCGLPNGAGEMCLSGNPTTCPGGNQVGGPCEDKCRPDEYAAACGGVGPGPVPDPPPGCRTIGAVPAGIVYYCCPCG